HGEEHLLARRKVKSRRLDIAVVVDGRFGAKRGGHGQRSHPSLVTGLDQPEEERPQGAGRRCQIALPPALPLRSPSPRWPTRQGGFRSVLAVTVLQLGRRLMADGRWLHEVSTFVIRQFERRFRLPRLAVFEYRVDDGFDIRYTPKPWTPTTVVFP